jgi:hypothetical protein
MTARFYFHFRDEAAARAATPRLQDEGLSVDVRLGAAGTLWLALGASTVTSDDELDGYEARFEELADERTPTTTATLPAVEPEILLRRAVEAFIEAEDHPVMDERDEALAEVGLMLQQVVMKQLTDVSELDPRYVTLDGLKPLSEHSDGTCELDVLGAFYMLDGNRDRMLPVEAHLSVKPGAESEVKLGGEGSTFELPTSERQFMRRMENVHWAHRLSLRLA